MRGKDLLNNMSEVDNDLITESEEAFHTNKKKPVWTKWAAMAACLCLVIVGVFITINNQDKQDGNPVQTWNSSFTAVQYFKYSNSNHGVSSESSFSDSAIPYAENRDFSDDRSISESIDTIPAMETHPIYNAQAHYNSDGSLYSVVLSWHRRDLDGLEHYSDLTVTAGYEEVPAVNDCILIELDENGNVVEPAVTVTERDGVQIVARGSEDQKKTITFQNESGWYQITGSWNDSYEDVVELLDWFWVHPIDFSQFLMDAGDNYTYSDLSTMPDALSEYLPDFGQYGFLCGESTVTLKNGVPVSVEAHYFSNVSAEQIENDEYNLGQNGCTEIHWCLETQPEYYDLEGCIGNLENVTKQQILNLVPFDKVTTQTKIQFMQGNYVVTIYATDVNQAWELIESIK